MASNKNLVGAAFAKEFFMGKSGFLAGAAVTVATTVLDNLVINPYEESLEKDSKKEIKKISLSNSSSGKKIISQNN